MGLAEIANQSACTRLQSRSRIWSWTPQAASHHSAKLHARWMHLRPPALFKTGRMHCQAMADKPGPLDDSSTVSPDISLLKPELQEQWHIVRNMPLGAIMVKPHSNIKAVWQCDQCPAGQLHVWEATVASRTRGRKCPYCCNRRVCLHNSLATMAPDVAQYWNHRKNAYTPEDVTACSTLKAEWKCSACKLEWCAEIGDRTRRGSGCAKCSAKSRIQQGQPTFAEAQPAELAEWDHERNQAEGLYPHKVSLGSGKQVHWICSCCPMGQPHRWTAMPDRRIGRSSGCAVCAGKQACVCNSLESLFPSIAAEFDVDKNGFSPSEITAHSDKEVWWRNAKRGSWRQSAHSRTDMRNWPSAKQGGV